jgi:hypothetical protein
VVFGGVFVTYGVNRDFVFVLVKCTENSGFACDLVTYRVKRCLVNFLVA